MADDKSTKRAHNFKDLTGKRFEMLTVISLDRIDILSGKRTPVWLCRCDCGRLKTVAGRHLARIVSCGCYRQANTIARFTTHGMRRTKEYSAWSDAKTRCFNTSYRTYPLYGGRGITMSDAWRNSFEQFLADMGPCPTGMSLERIDVNGNYCKENCKWATHLEQMHNQRKNIRVTYNGETLPLWDWSARSGVPLKILYGRHHRGTAILGPRTRRWAKRPKD